MRVSEERLVIGGKLLFLRLRLYFIKPLLRRQFLLSNKMVADPNFHFSFKKLAAGLGFEPRYQPPKGRVLPLDDPAMVLKI